MLNITTPNEWLHDIDPTGETMAGYYNGRYNPTTPLTTIKWNIDEDNETYTVTATYHHENINEEETERLRKWISGQNSDGLGESLEQQSINNKYYSLDWEPTLTTIQEEPGKTTITYKGQVNITDDEDDEWY